ncbi:MAG TPA: TetR/AcrR family transcriptional regulator [Cytophagales bacterium]|nr:TetR/AcrR family transcriptional regulator [Cytophagales bacterium]
MLIAQTAHTSQAQEILQGAAELFLRYGVKSITMDEIARHISVSKKTIYQHFADKDELVITFTRMVLEQQKSEMIHLENNGTNVMESLRDLSEFLRNKVCNINPSLLFDLKKYFPQAWKTFTEHKKTFLKDHLKRLLERGMKEGYFRANLNMNIISKMRIEQVEMIFNPDVFSETEFNISEVHIQLFQHFVYGICTLKGHEEFNRLMKVAD